MIETAADAVKAAVECMDPADGDVQRAQAWATIAQAKALLQEITGPSDEELDAFVQEAIEAAGDFDQKATKKLLDVETILARATRDGSRRHPAILEALEVIRSEALDRRSE